MSTIMVSSERTRNFTTRAVSEVTNLIWEIENFNKSVRSEDVLKSIVLKFEAGTMIQSPIKWQFQFITTKLKGDLLGIQLATLESIEKCKGMVLNYDLVFKRGDGSEFKRLRLYYDICSAGDPHKAELFYLNSFPTALCPLSDFLKSNAGKGTEKLIMEIRFEMFKPSAVSTFERTSSRSTKIESIQEKSKMEILEGIKQINAECEKFADFKLVMKDGKEFPVHRIILACQSQVFEKMFESNLSEAASGIVQIPDVSSQAMRIILKFLYSGGIVVAEWEDVFHELIYASEKYELIFLKELCDNMLVEIVTKENARNFLNLAVKFSLETAKKDIIDYISKNFSDQDILKTIGFMDG